MTELDVPAAGRALDRARCLKSILQADSHRLGVLRIVQRLALPDCWVAAGFVRNAVWDHLHGRTASQCYDDVDVIWYQPVAESTPDDADIEARLRLIDGSIKWSVKNQARMHGKNGDLPYRSATHAMLFWVETSAAIAVRLDDGDALEIAAPAGIDDIFDMQVRPMGRFCGELRPVYVDRMRRKAWQAQWPRLTIAP
jgi:hypothetical protein